jgi:hypothetical protein
MTDAAGPEGTEVSLTEIESQRQASDKRTRDGQSGPVLYRIEYHNDESTVVQGKSTEVGRIVNSDRMGLEAIPEDKYAYYAVFRLEDRSTVTIVQDVSGDLYKILSLGRNSVRVSHSVTITEAAD